MLVRAWTVLVLRRGGYEYCTKNFKNDGSYRGHSFTTPGSMLMTPRIDEIDFCFDDYLIFDQFRSVSFPLVFEWFSVRKIREYHSIINMK